MPQPKSSPQEKHQPAGQTAIDLQALAEKIVERLRRELELERERSGR